MQKINIGMTKDKVVEILGDQYKSSGGELSEDDILIQKITYFDIEGLEYEFIFKNGQLSKWEKVRQHHNHLHKKDQK